MASTTRAVSGKDTDNPDVESGDPLISIPPKSRQEKRCIWTELRKCRWWLLCMLIFATLWTAELWLVQQYTLIPAQQVGPVFARYAPKVRFLLDLCFTGALSIILWRWCLALLAVASSGLAGFLLTYFYYFHRPFSILTLLNNASEGAAVSSLAIVPVGILWAVGLPLTLKLLALALARGATLPRIWRWAICGTFIAAFASIFALGNLRDPLNKILTTRGVGRLGVSRGYAGPWIAELYYLGDDEILRRALEERRLATDRLTPVETAFEVGDKLVVIQAESLDYNVLGYKIHSQLVAPFLTGLRDKSLFYRFHALHSNGSADADFTVLNGVPPSNDVLNYNIPGYPFENTLPQYLANFGYRSFSFHGNGGSFYNRRAAFEKMKFTRIKFKENLVLAPYNFSVDDFGVRDRDVLSVSSKELHESSGKTFHFIITLTSHTPFTLIPPAERQIFPNEADMGEGYFNSIRYLDNALKAYVESLPDGTTVMIYGDHAASITYGDYDSNSEPPTDCVPCMIYKKGEDLSTRQLTRDTPLAKGGSLTLVDLATYLRTQVKRSQSHTK